MEDQPNSIDQAAEEDREQPMGSEIREVREPESTPDTPPAERPTHDPGQAPVAPVEESRDDSAKDPGGGDSPPPPAQPDSEPEADDEF